MVLLIGSINDKNVGGRALERVKRFFKLCVTKYQAHHNDHAINGPFIIVNQRMVVIDMCLILGKASLLYANTQILNMNTVLFGYVKVHLLTFTIKLHVNNDFLKEGSIYAHLHLQTKAVGPT